MNSDTNALKKFEESIGMKKIPYIILLLLGILFLVASVSTLYTLYQVFETNGFTLSITQPSVILMYGYIVLNLIAGYGMVFCRTWILKVFSINAVLMFLTGIFFYLSQDRFVDTVFSAGSISLFLFLVLFLLRKNLIEFKRSNLVISIYMVVLLVTVYMSYFF